MESATSSLTNQFYLAYSFIQEDIMTDLLRAGALGIVLVFGLMLGTASAQTADLRFTTTINAGAGTGGLDQLLVEVEMNTDVTFGLGTSTIQYTFNDAALAVPSGAVANDQLTAGTDYDYDAAFTDYVAPPTLPYNNTMTLSAANNRPSLNIVLTADNFFPGTITSATWTRIAQMYFDITDNLSTAQLAWIPNTDPNPIFIKTADNVTVVGNGIFTDNDADLDAGLPVELVDFAVTTDAGELDFAWSTASESGSAGFQVEYAEAGSDAWTSLGYVESVGNSNETSNYSFTATAIGFGDYRFRIKAVDADGSYGYSDIVELSLDVPDSYVLSTPYPNPFNPSAAFTLAISEEQNVRVELYNMLGQRMEVLHDGALEADQSHTFQIDGSTLSSGMYLVRVAGETFSTTKTATLLK